MAGRLHPRSWYTDTALPQPDHPELTGEIRCDVCVVGGGYTGLSAALHLAERGYDVVVLEAEKIGWGASGRNGGQIVTAYNPSMGTMAGWVGKDDARLPWELGEESKAILRDRVARHRIDCDLRWGYVMAALKQRQMAGLRDMEAEWRHDYGYGEVLLLDRSEIRSMVASDAYVGGLFDGGSGQLHPLNYAIGLGRAAAEAGARIFEGSRVLRIETGAEPAAHTAVGTVRARHLVLAGNAYLWPSGPGTGGQDHAGRHIHDRHRTIGGKAAADLIPCGHAVADVNFVLNYYRRSPDHRLLFGGGVSYSALDRPDLKRLLRRTMLRYFPQLTDARIDSLLGRQCRDHHEPHAPFRPNWRQCLLRPRLFRPWRGADRAGWKTDRGSGQRDSRTVRRVRPPAPCQLPRRRRPHAAAGAGDDVVQVARPAVI